MTLNEYKEFVKEYFSTDSISRKDDIESKLLDAAVALAKRLQELYESYGKDFIDDSEWSSERGGYSIEDIYYDHVSLTYHDHWRYGGECHIGIVVPAKYFDPNERNALRSKLRKECIEACEQHIAYLEDDMARTKENIGFTKARIDELRKEEEVMKRECGIIDSTSSKEEQDSE